MTDDHVRHAVHLWERRPNETAKAFAAFVAYRDQPAIKRSIRQAAEDTEGSEQMFTRWSNRHDWVERSAAYDDFLDGYRREKNLGVLDEMADRQAEAAIRMQTIALESLTRLSEAMEINQMLRLKEGNIMQFLTQGATMERVARGEPSSITEFQDGTIEVEWRGPAPEGTNAPDASGTVGSPTD